MADDTELQWELNHFVDRKRAFEYLRSLKDIFCVYSSTDCKIYSNYQLNYSCVGEDRIEVVPDLSVWNDTFSFISPAAIVPSGVLVFPGQVFGQNGFYVRLPLKGGRGKTMPLAQAFDHLLGRESHFLPLLRKGDLREFKGKAPYIHLHCLEVSKLDQWSALQRADVVDTFSDRFHDIINTTANI